MGTFVIGPNTMTKKLYENVKFMFAQLYKYVLGEKTRTDF